ncbi:MAG: hypothetical protein F6K41_16405 [Symploca sp. SIO3E6]|nr:hypothetical protein [Caldora sp. SIO3E6]
MLYHVRLITYTLVATRQRAEGRRQKAEGKKESCKVEGYDKCLAGHDIRW